MSKNDDKILSIKDLIEKKRESMGKKPRFVPTTNCSLEFRGTRYNIHAMNDMNQLSILACEIKAIDMVAEELGLAEYTIISGYNVRDWLKDILLKMDVLAYTQKERELSVLEGKLDGLLSSDKKTELQIAKLADTLNGI